MLQEIQSWPQKLKDGLDIAHNFHFEYSGALPTNINKIVFFGMGGSGIAGKIIKTLLDKKITIPSMVVEGPVVPEYVDTSTLAFVVSYSGNTWETLEAFNTLIDKHIPTIVLSNNGKLLEISEEKNILHILVPKSNMPRSALGSFLGIILGLLDLMGLAQGKAIVEGFVKHLLMYLPKLEDEAYYKEFLDLVDDKDMFHIWGVSGDSDTVAFRAQTQFNENSKVRAVFSSFPEACHNLLVGFTESKEKPLVVIFSTEFVSPSLELAQESLSEVFNEGVVLYKPPVLGDNWREQLLHIIIWSDFASYYLARKRDVDPEPVVMIDKLKKIFTQKMAK